MEGVGGVPPVSGSGYVVGSGSSDPAIVALLQRLDDEMGELLKLLKGGAKEWNETVYNLIKDIQAKWTQVQDYMQGNINPFPNPKVALIWQDPQFQAAMKFITEDVPPLDSKHNSQQDVKNYWNYVLSSAFRSHLSDALNGNGGLNIDEFLTAEENG